MRHICRSRRPKGDALMLTRGQVAVAIGSTVLAFQMTTAVHSKDSKPSARGKAPTHVWVPSFRADVLPVLVQNCASRCCTVRSMSEFESAGARRVAPFRSECGPSPMSRLFSSLFVLLRFKKRHEPLVIIAAGIFWRGSEQVSGACPSMNQRAFLLSSTPFTTHRNQEFPLARPLEWA